MSLLTNLIAYWKLDEASGSALDAVGSNDLTANGSIGSTTGKVGNARSLVASGFQYFSHSSNSDLQTGDIDFSLAFWVRFTSQPGTEVLFHKGADVGTHEYQCFLSGGALNFRVQNNAASVSVGSSLANSTWYYVVCWHDSINNQIGISLNAGTPVTASYSGGVTTSTDLFYLGNDSGGGRPLDGLLDEFGFWKRVLTSQERTDLYNGGAGLAFSSFGGGGGGGVTARPASLLMAC